MYTAKQLSEELAKYGVRLTPATIYKYAAKDLIPIDKDALYPDETLEQLYASYYTLHMYGEQYVTYIKVATARQIALGDYPHIEVPRYIAPKYWLAQLDRFRRLRRASDDTRA